MKEPGYSPSIYCLAVCIAVSYLCLAASPVAGYAGCACVPGNWTVTSSTGKQLGPFYGCQKPAGLDAQYPLCFVDPSTCSGTPCRGSHPCTFWDFCSSTVNGYMSTWLPQPVSQRGCPSDYDKYYQGGPVSFGVPVSQSTATPMPVNDYAVAGSSSGFTGTLSTSGASTPKATAAPLATSASSGVYRADYSRRVAIYEGGVPSSTTTTECSILVPQYTTTFSGEW